MSARQVDELKDVYKNYKDKNIKFANAVIAETDEFGSRLISEDDVYEYVKRTKLPFPVYMDEADMLVRDYNIETVPFIAFVTGEGGLMLTRPFTYGKDIIRILDALIAGRQIDATGMETIDG